MTDLRGLIQESMVMARAQRRNRPILDNVVLALQRSSVPPTVLEAEMTRSAGIKPIPSFPIFTQSSSSGIQRTSQLFGKNKFCIIYLDQ